MTVYNANGCDLGRKGAGRREAGEHYIRTVHVARGEGARRRGWYRWPRACVLAISVACVGPTGRRRRRWKGSGKTGRYRWAMAGDGGTVARSRSTAAKYAVSTVRSFDSEKHRAETVWDRAAILGARCGGDSVGMGRWGNGGLRTVWFGDCARHREDDCARARAQGTSSLRHAG